MKACSVLQNVKHRDPNAMPPERSLEFATINAAKALGLESEIGSLEPGKRADAVLFDLSNPHCCPASNPISALVCSAKGTDAHTVFVNGKPVVSEHRLTSRVNVGELLDRGRRRAAEVVAKSELKHRTLAQWNRRQE